MRLSVRLYAFVITTLVCFSAVNHVSAQNGVQAGQVLINELRYRGPNGTRDEFIEIYNNTDADITVQATDQSSGWAVSASNGEIRGNVCLIPNGTVIPARGYFLCANTDPEFGSGYSLDQYPSGTTPPCPSSTPNGTEGDLLLPPQFGPTTPDATFVLFDDLPDGFGVALFTTQLIPNQTAATRLDSFGFINSPALYKEGNGFPTIPSVNNEHTIYRKLATGFPQDAQNNAVDFLYISTTASLQPTINGAPGPQNRCSPIVNNATINASLVDPESSATSTPNEERRAGEIEPNANLGTFYLRRAFTNNTGQAITRLRFRIVNMTTRGTPAFTCPQSNCADLRALTSPDETFNQITVRGVTLEEN
ncbi:MAG TPA: lamin tail domain-containing protein, partial [Pyrinomonadaceae bacterium]